LTSVMTAAFMRRNIKRPGANANVQAGPEWENNPVQRGPSVNTWPLITVLVQWLVYSNGSPS
jgi:hypothetical protein